jgi:hypothetical protein
MNEHHLPEQQTGAAGPRTGLIVVAIGLVLGLVGLGGFLLRDTDSRRLQPPGDNNLTSVPPDAALREPNQPPPAGLPESGPPADALQQPADDEPPTAQMPADETAADASPPPETQDPPAPPAVDPEPPPPPAAGTPLADLEPLDVVGVQRGTSGLWQPVQIAGKQYDQALRIARSPNGNGSQISFLLNGNGGMLHGLAGLQDPPAATGSAAADQAAAIFRIYGDANLLWESQPLTAPGSCEAFTLDVRDTEVLSLAVESELPAGAAQPAWADLRLLPPTDEP